MNKQLEHLTEEQASKFVDEDIARFEYYGYSGHKILIFNQTGNTYHKTHHGTHYELIGSMQTQPTQVSRGGESG